MMGLLISLTRVPWVVWILASSVFVYFKYNEVIEGELEPMKQQLESKKAEVRKLKTTIDKVQEFQKLKEAKINEREETQKRFEAALNKIPKSAEIPKLLKILSGLANQVGLDVEFLKPGNPSSVEFLGLVPIEVKITGTYTQILSYMDAVSEETRVIAPQKIKLDNPQRRGTASLVSAVLSFNAYSMDIPAGTASAAKSKGGK